LPDDARAELNRLLGRLRQVRALSRVDPACVLTLARLTAILDQAFARIAAEGVMVAGPGGSVQPHPLLRTINALTLRQKSLLQSFGLLERVRVSGEGFAPESIKADDSKWAGILRLADEPPCEGG
jgi:hypothetical protein